MKRSLLKRGTALLSTAAMLLTYADFSAIGSVFAENETPELLPYDVNGDNIFDDSEKAYELTDADDLYWFAAEVNSGNKTINAYLADDITLNENLLKDLITVKDDGTAEVNADKTVKKWTTAGSGDIAYSGLFDGEGHTISGLYINDSTAEYVGLFGTSVGVIRDVHIADSYIYGLEFVGGISGASSGLIADCSFEGCVTAEENVAGGICGFNYFGKIRNCSEKCTVIGYSEVGGICGYNADGTISNCSDDESSSVYASYYAGGICGVNYDGGELTECTSAGKVSGNDYVGGICGVNQADSNITECSFSGTVSAEDIIEDFYVGGICGGNLSTVGKCTNTGTVTAKCAEEVGIFTFVGGICGGNASVVTECSNEGAVSGKTPEPIVGGICGYSYMESITENCINKGTVTAEGTGTEIYSGGICGGNGGYVAGCYNTGSVTGNEKFSGVCGLNEDGIIENCYYLDTVAEDSNAAAMTAQQFASGEVCWLLNGGETQYATHAFFQNLSEKFGGVDALPVFDSTHHTVVEKDGVYSNVHNYENGLCTVCGSYESAEIVADSDDIDGDENTTETVYEISNAGQLYWFANEVNSGNNDINAYLAEDITVNSGVFDEDGELNEAEKENFTAWNPIGTYTSYYVNNPYSGTFDGNNKTISGLYFNYNDNENDADYVGLFGYVGTGGKIQDVTIADSYMYGKTKVGGVCGNNEGTIENAAVADSYMYGNFVGGVCGANYGTISKCYNTGDVKGTGNYVGGVCGYNSGTITNCYYLDTVAEDLYATAMTAQQFASGEVCWLLNGGETQYATHAFFQNLSEKFGGVDALPVLDSTHHTVVEKDGVYSNVHNYENGLCTVCGSYESAEIVADSDDIDGDGNITEDVYKISNAGQLYWFAAEVNSGNKTINAYLAEDITVNSGVFDEDGELNEAEKENFTAWNPIGTYTSYYVNNPYSGTFDGKGHTISGLYFNTSYESYAGLFGYVVGGTIRNVNVDDSYFNGYSYVSGICGYGFGATIENSSSNAVINGNTYAAGICAENNTSHVINCFNTGRISGGQYVGGVCAGNEEGTIENSYNTAEINGTMYVGGVCGDNFGTESIIRNCYNRGDVSGNEYVGGISGDNYGETSRITNCYSTGKVEGSEAYGAICGEDILGALTKNCFWLADSENENGAVTIEQFKSGEVAYKLGGAFFQNLSEEDFPVLDSNHKPVYLASPCPAYTNTEGETSEHSFNGEICGKCGAFKDGIGARLAGTSLSLDGSIGVNFYMQLAEDVLEDETAYMLFTLPNVETSEIKVSEADTETVGDVTYYVFKCNVAATEMSDTIKAQIITGNGSGTEYSYSVKEYADYLLENADENENYKKAEELVKAMLNYGAYAQILKEHNTDNLSYVPMDMTAYSVKSHSFTADSSDNVEFKGANLSMLSSTTLRLFFEIGDKTDVTIKSGSKNLEIGENNGLYFVEIKNIAPQDIDNDFTVEVNDNGESFSVTYSPLAYCCQVAQKKADEALVNLVKAIALYNDAAEIYFMGVL